MVWYSYLQLLRFIHFKISNTDGNLSQVMTDFVAGWMDLQKLMERRTATIHANGEWRIDSSAKRRSKGSSHKHNYAHAGSKIKPKLVSMHLIA
jgi:hypothetical protein